MEWIVQLPILFLSVVVHELSHGLTAFYKGDKTAEQAGRLTLNPIPHIDPFGTIFLPILCFLTRMPMFGWAKPVPVNVSRLRNPKRDWMWVALAGPGSNLLMALIFAVLFRATAAAPFIQPGLQRTMSDAWIFAVSINLFLAFFNLIPVHPLDGSQIVRSLIPFAWRRAYDRHIPYGMAIIVLLMLTHALNVLVMVPSTAALHLLAQLGLIW